MAQSLDQTNQPNTRVQPLIAVRGIIRPGGVNAPIFEQDGQVVSISSGADDAGSVPVLGPNGQLDPSMIPPITGPYIEGTPGEDVQAGDFVYCSEIDGLLYLADWSAANAFQAVGFMLVTAPAGQPLAAYSTSGQDKFLNGLTPGARYYGDPANPGGVTSTLPKGAGVLSQFLGYAVSSTSIDVDITDSIVLAS